MPLCLCVLDAVLFVFADSSQYRSLCGAYRMTARFPTAQEFASFPEPNYVDPTTRFPLALGVAVPTAGLVAVFMSCRLYCRTVLVKTLGWDDGMMTVAAVSRIPQALVCWRLMLVVVGDCE